MNLDGYANNHHCKDSKESYLYISSVKETRKGTNHKISHAHTHVSQIPSENMAFRKDQIFMHYVSSNIRLQLTIITIDFID